MTAFRLIKIYVCLGFFINSVYGQELKKEKEVRIGATEAPLAAQKIISGYDVNKKIKWYKQTNFDTISFEAKFKKKGDFYSVSFDTLGVVIDIEKLIKWKNIDESTKDKIEVIFNDEFKKFKIIKCQIQYTPEEFDLENFFTIQLQSTQSKVNYEIEVEGKNTNWLKFEFLLKEDGRILRKREIVDVSTENLNY